jgi:hypothetical protein
VKTVAVLRFSPARTVGLLGGLAGMMVVGVVLMAREPDFSMQYR